MTTVEKQENTRICEKCNKNPTISKSSPYCPSCMAGLSNKARSNKARKGKNTKKTKPQRARKREGHSKDKPEKSPPGRNTAVITIDFGKHGSVLSAIKQIAEEELRTVDMQIVFMLKRQLDDTQR
jgi:hypothetical protein